MKSKGTCRQWLISAGATSIVAASTLHGQAVAERDSAGVKIVESRSAAWSGGATWQVSATPMLSIGVVDGAEVYQFDGIGDVSRLEDGRILVADRGSNELRLFDASGAHVLTFGGYGSGPGEFRDLGSLVITGNTVSVLDGALGRLTVFDASGQLLETQRLEDTGNPIHPLRMYGLGGIDGRRLVLVARAFPADMRPTAMVYWDTLPTLQYDAEGSMVGRVGEAAGMDTYSTPGVAGSTTFARFSSSDMHDGLLYMTDGGEYEVRVYRPGQGLERIQRLLEVRRPVTEALIDRFFEGMAERAPPEARQQVLGRRSSWEHGDRLPWISRILVDDEGYLWVGEYQHRFDLSPSSWGIFDPEGRWLGRVILPARFRPTHVGRSTILGVARDEFDVQYVHELALDRAN